MSSLPALPIQSENTFFAPRVVPRFRILIVFMPTRQWRTGFGLPILIIRVVKYTAHIVAPARKLPFRHKQVTVSLTQQVARALAPLSLHTALFSKCQPTLTAARSTCTKLIPDSILKGRTQRGPLVFYGRFCSQRRSKKK
jgi:hypothetical protein